MRTRYKIFDNEAVFFVSSSIVEWKEIFVSSSYFEIIMNTLNFKRQDYNLKILAYVIMKNHIHLILRADDLKKFMKEFKSYTAREIVKQLKIDNRSDLLNFFNIAKKSYKNDSTYQIWQEGFHPELISDINIFRQKAEYIHNNPVRKGYVSKPEDWIYSSARNYILGNGVLEIDSVF